MRMNLWTGRLIILGALLWFVGFGLGLAFGNDGVGDENPGWLIGGLMVYVCFPVFLLAAGCEAVTRLRTRRGRGLSA